MPAGASGTTGHSPSCKAFAPRRRFLHQPTAGYTGCPHRSERSKTHTPRTAPRALPEERSLLDTRPSCHQASRLHHHPEPCIDGPRPALRPGHRRRGSIAAFPLADCRVADTRPRSNFPDREVLAERIFQNTSPLGQRLAIPTPHTASSRNSISAPSACAHASHFSCVIGNR